MVRDLTICLSSIVVNSTLGEVCGIQGEITMGFFFFFYSRHERESLLKKQKEYEMLSERTEFCGKKIIFSYDDEDHMF